MEIAVHPNRFERIFRRERALLWILLGAGNQQSEGKNGERRLSEREPDSENIIIYGSLFYVHVAKSCLAKAEAQLRKHSAASGPTGDARTAYCDPYKKNVMCGHLLQTNTDLWIDVVLSSAYSSRASHSCQIEVAKPQRFRDSRFKGKICQ